MIGDKEVVFHTTLIVPDGQIASFDAHIGDWKFKVTIEFKPEEGEKPAIQWKGEPDALHMIFKHWSSASTSTKVPFKLGILNDKTPFGFLAFNSRVGDTNRIDFHLLRGGIYND